MEEPLIQDLSNVDQYSSILIIRYHQSFRISSLQVWIPSDVMATQGTPLVEAWIPRLRDPLDPSGSWVRPAAAPSPTRDSGVSSSAGHPEDTGDNADMPHLGCSSQGAKTKRKAYIGLGYEGMLPVTIFPLELLDLIHCIDPGGRDHAGQSL
mmetsp:Transcript_78273/g.172734  ORF Transcript_78273/g.172734 Transcript_78273/m.172734 type:complete len:152 (+) Transcript_78273:115-570(+)